MEETLAKFRLLTSVSGTDTTFIKENLKKRGQWGNPLQNSGCYQNKRKKESSVGEPLTNSGSSIQLAELIPLKPKNKKEN